MATEVSNSLSWLADAENRRKTKDELKSTSKSPSLQEMTTTIFGRDITESFVDRLILSFGMNRKNNPNPTYPTPLKGIGIDSRNDMFSRRRLPNGHKYGEYQVQFFTLLIHNSLIMVLKKFEELFSSRILICKKN